VDQLVFELTPLRRWAAGSANPSFVKAGDLALAVLSERNRAAVGCNLAGRQGLGVDVHRELPTDLSLYAIGYIVVAEGVQPLFDRLLIGLRHGGSAKT
jgi:hypothetical protein